MYNIKKGVKVSDFSQDTKDFLTKIGFSKEEDISNLFGEFLKENKLSLNYGNVYEHIGKFELPEVTAKLSESIDYVQNTYTKMYKVLENNKSENVIATDKVNISRVFCDNIFKYKQIRLGGVS